VWLRNTIQRLSQPKTASRAHATWTKLFWPLLAGCPANESMNDFDASHVGAACTDEVRGPTAPQVKPITDAIVAFENHILSLESSTQHAAAICGPAVQRSSTPRRRLPRSPPNGRCSVMDDGVSRTLHLQVMATSLCSEQNEDADEIVRGDFPFRRWVNRSV
jgi:hypothetical protein